MCAAVDKDPTKHSELEHFETGYCLGWIAGFTGGVRVTEIAHGVEAKHNGFCLLVGNNYGQMINIIRKFIADNPEKEHLPTVALAIAALAKAFPCRESK